MNKDDLLQYLAKLDASLQKPAKLYIYGGAALMLLEEETRISLDIDVAAPYSEVDYSDFCQACLSAGIPLSAEFRQPDITHPLRRHCGGRMKGLF